MARVSDLQCPARVFLARHGETAYETELLMDHGGSLTALGRSQARELGEKLRAERIAHVYSSTVSRAVVRRSVPCRINDPNTYRRTRSIVRPNT